MTYTEKDRQVGQGESEDLAARRPTIQDNFGREFTYLRVALTDRCNLRCIYCMPEEGVAFSPAEILLTDEEILRLVRICADLGVRKLRFTGGEPLIRPNLSQLISEVSRTPGIEDVTLTTNGVLLTEKVVELKQAGLTGLNISIDTLKPDRFEHITRRAKLEQVLEGLAAATDQEFNSIKVNVVALKGFNDDEIGDFAQLGRTGAITTRFIELMPFDAHQIWKTGHFMGADHIIARLKENFPDLVEAKGSATEKHVFSVPEYRGKLAVIPAYTRSICGSCNRIRVTADGQLRNCLYSTQEYDLRSSLRADVGDADIGDIILDAMGSKLVDGWSAQRAGQEQTPSHLRDSMTQIGG